ncbi:MAG: hypothetical protein ACRDRS_20875 [Pseudonocardiaceae bacterium]
MGAGGASEALARMLESVSAEVGGMGRCRMSIRACCGWWLAGVAWLRLLTLSDPMTPGTPPDQ